MDRPIVFDFADYRSFLKAALDWERKRQRGAQARLARHMGCQSAYLSMALAGRADLSLEQASAAGEHLGLTPREMHFFLLLLQRQRAGTAQLRAYFQQQIEDALAARLNLVTRFENQKTLTPEQRAQYYSSWVYWAVHIGLTVPSLQSAEKIGAYLQLTPAVVHQVLDFLVQTGLAEQRGAAYVTGPTQLHTGRDSPFIQQAHINWRLQTLMALQRPRDENFHYSSVVSMSTADLSVLREIMVRAIESIRATVRASPEEEIVLYSMDLFPLRPGARPPA